MNQLSNQEILEVSGATAQDVAVVTAAIVVGGAVGFLTTSLK